MKSRPILFSAPMVRALLDGSKTQTRRVAKLTYAAHIKEIGGHRRWHPTDPDVVAASPYGQVGDQLWVRETFNRTNPHGKDGHYFYRADEAHEFPGAIWKPSIFMPRAASRITLEITGVRVERLQDISADDCYLEGADVWAHENSEKLLGDGGKYRSIVQAYKALWESINGAGSWDLNPWVWVIEFKKVKP
jgi:hypothetical protein